MKTTDRFISVSFRYFHNVDDIGQSIDSWRVDGSLPDLIEKLVYLTANGITKVSSDGIFTNYTRFPDSAVNDFKCPDEISVDENWGVIKKYRRPEKKGCWFFKG
ncbi:hypothetical protein IE982_22820 [Enterobacter hormaechei]|uniref:Uncharacterized protein n=1 Tax=Enterobacter hormaechei TaxID=158836 RepID=A0A927HMB6_9ENTR|nr:hypothetical protein [Enterobacter hormaechei]MBD3699095.1 hypothetical protein [Enterobacter hormaechei]MBD3707371.1 hypothetical protein [Enterobacter hormaechei]MBD3707377.1 hypothetical protein [Enterobacter hormaechei]